MLKERDVAAGVNSYSQKKTFRIKKLMYAITRRVTDTFLFYNII